MAKRPVCPFTFIGHPTTAPNTPADEKRIKLSQWLTRLIGDDYQTPGANGYSEQALADAAERYAHLLSGKPVVPDAELQLQALALLEAGVSRTEIQEELDLPSARLRSWLQNEPFRSEYEAAKAGGSGKRIKSSAVRDSATARRVPPPTPSSPMPEQSFTTTQRQALDLLASGKTSKEVMSTVKGLWPSTLSDWRKNPDFLAAWNEAKAKGALVRESKPAAEKPAKAASLKTPRETVIPDSTMTLLVDSPPATGIKPSASIGKLRELQDAHSQANDDYMRHVGKCMGLREAAETVQKTAAERFVQGKDKSAIALRNMSNLLATLLKGHESMRDDALQVAVKASNELSAAKANA